MVELLECQVCGEQVSSNARKCPHCGAPHESSVGISEGRKGILIVLGCLVTMVGVGLIIWVFSDPDRLIASNKGNPIAQTCFYAVPVFGILIIIRALKANTK